jgi:hypothetical protein
MRKTGALAMKLGGTSLAVKRRIATRQPYFVGDGIDVGGGRDPMRNI